VRGKVVVLAADHEEDGDGFAKRPPNREHERGAETAARLRNGDVQHGLGAGEAQRARGVALGGGHGAEGVVAEGDDAMKNAIHVAFLEELDFRGSHGSEAFTKLTPALKKGWRDINEYMETLLDGEWTWKGPANTREG